MGRPLMRLYLDACAIIYAVEGVASFRVAALQRITRAESAANGFLLTSRLSSLECRVKPIRQNVVALLSAYESFFSRTSLHVIDVAAWVIDRATALRALHNPDVL